MEDHLKLDMAKQCAVNCFVDDLKVLFDPRGVRQAFNVVYQIIETRSGDFVVV